MTEEASRYRAVHRLLGQAKAAGWRISRTPAGHWRLKHPSGAAVTIAPWPTVRALAAAEVQLARIERQHQSTTMSGPPCAG